MGFYAKYFYSFSAIKRQSKTLAKKIYTVIDSLITNYYSYMDFKGSGIFDRTNTNISIFSNTLSIYFKSD
jgi:hypothetical protein